jgi:hypothetical protein
LSPSTAINSPCTAAGTIFLRTPHLKIRLRIRTRSLIVVRARPDLIMTF